MMKKVWLIAAIALILVGSLAFVGAMALSGFDFSVLDTQELVSNTYVFEDTIEKILVDVDTTDIRFLPAEDGVCKVVCQERDKLRHAVYVNEKTLFIKLVDTRDWYEHIEFFGSEMKITVYLPTDQYFSLEIETDTGDVKFLRADAQTLNVKTDTGDVKGSLRTDKIFDVKSNTGKENVVQTGKGGMCRIRCSTGDIRITIEPAQ